MSMYDGISPKQQYRSRMGAMWTERSSWDTRYRRITDNLLPYAGRYTSSDRNKGDRSFNNIYDSTATRALRVLTSGMMGGMTSPARPWFRLATPDRELMEYEPVKYWLHDVTELMRDIFAKSNTYNSLHSIYKELGAFATAASLVEGNFDNVLHHHTMTAGQYAIATNDLGQVDTFARKYDMTLMQIVAKFVYSGDPNGPADWSVVSPTIKNMWDTHKNHDQWITVNHIIQPREARDVGKRDARNMRFASCYFEDGGDDKTFLRESGYKRFPVLAPRWDVAGGDIYGNGPSFDAMGDIMQLQQEQLRKGQGIDYQTKPPLQVPAERKNAQVSQLPGGVSYIPMNGQSQGVKPLFEVSINMQHLLEDIVDVRGRINSCFYADMFLMMSEDSRRQRATATEIAEKHEEKLVMLGPVLERLHNELLSPKIDMTFDMMLEARILPPPPPELDGVDLKVEFVSTLAQAQKMVGIGAIDSLIGRVAQLSAASQDIGVWDKVNKDESIDRWADMLGVDPSVIVGDDKVAIVRDQRAQAMAAQQAAAAAPAAAGAMKDMAAAGEGDGLSNIMQRVQGYSAPLV